MKRFECPVCRKKTTKVYAKDRRYIPIANCIIRYRQCKFCDTKFVTKEDLNTHEETLLKLLYRSNKELILGEKFYDEASWID